MFKVAEVTIITEDVRLENGILTLPDFFAPGEDFVLVLSTIDEETQLKALGFILREGFKKQTAQGDADAKRKKLAALTGAWQEGKKQLTKGKKLSVVSRLMDGFALMDVMMEGVPKDKWTARKKQLLAANHDSYHAQAIAKLKEASES
jgi:hypothetical protein